MAVSTRQAGSSSRTSSATTARNQTLAAIASMVSTEIVPRLLAAQQARSGDATAKHAPPPAFAPAAFAGASSPSHELADAESHAGIPVERRKASGSALSAPDAGFIVQLAEDLIAGNLAAIRQRIEQLSRDGMTAEQLCLLALAPVARYLDDEWEADRCSFLDVTSGTAVLHGIMNELRPAFQNRAVAGVRRRSAVLVTAPGEQHRFGLSMLAEFFRKEGWQVALPTGTTIAQVTALAAARPIDLVGFSAGSDRQLGALAACIAALRASSYNPDIIVMVGGPVFLERPELVQIVGADATAGDAEEAVKRAQALLKTRRAAISRRVTRSSMQSRQSTSTRAAACSQGTSHAP